MTMCVLRVVSSGPSRLPVLREAAATLCDEVESTTKDECRLAIFGVGDALRALCDTLGSPRCLYISIVVTEEATRCLRHRQFEAAKEYYVEGKACVECAGACAPFLRRSPRACPWCIISNEARRASEDVKPRM